MTAGLGASIEGVCRRSGFWWGIAGLVLSLPSVALITWFEPTAMILSAAFLGFTIVGRRRLLTQDALQARRRSEWAAKMHDELRRPGESGRQG
jgi:hypothetical protein